MKALRTKSWLLLTDFLNRLGIFHITELRTITVGNLPVKPRNRYVLKQLDSWIPWAIQIDLNAYT